MNTSILIEIASTLGWTLLHFLWQGALVGVFYALARYCLKSDLGRHRAAMCGLFAALALPVITFHSLWINASAGAATGINPVVGALATETLGMETVDAVAQRLAWTAWLTALWLIGALLIACRLVRDWLQLRRVIRNSLPAPATLIAVLEREIERFGLRRRVGLRLTASYNTPGVYGIFRPVILMPVALLLRLPTDQVEALIVHELAHVRRLDALGNLLAITTRTLLYFHPVVHWLAHDLERLRERLCDDLVLERKVDRVNYARALSSAALTQNMTPAALLTATGGELTSRVHHILGMDEPVSPQRNRLAPLLFAVTTIAVSVLGLHGISGSFNAADARPEIRVITGLLAPSLLGSSEPLIAYAPTLEAPKLLARAASERETPIEVITVHDVVASPTPAGSAEVAPKAFDADSASVSESSTAALIKPVAMPAAVQQAAADDVYAIAVTSPLDQPESFAADLSTHQSTSEPLPRATRIVRPRYPTSALRSELEGTITLSFRVNSDGRASAIEVVDPDPTLKRLESTAIAALEQWRFEHPPSTAARYQQEFSFNLGGGGVRTCNTGSRICRLQGQYNR